MCRVPDSCHRSSLLGGLRVAPCAPYTGLTDEGCRCLRRKRWNYHGQEVLGEGSRRPGAIARKPKWTGTSQMCEVEAHVALVAQHFLREKLRHKVKDLLKGDLVDFAHYEERLTVANSTMCHFHHQSPEWQCGQGIGRQGKVHCDGSEAGYFSLLCAVGLTFQKFAHDAVLAAHSQWRRIGSPPSHSSLQFKRECSPRMQEYPKSDYFKMPKPSDYWSNFKRLPEAAQYTDAEADEKNRSTGKDRDIRERRSTTAFGRS
eukprot:g16624.t1